MKIRCINISFPSFRKYKFVDPRPASIAVDIHTFEFFGFKVRFFTTRKGHDGEAPKVKFFRFTKY